MKKLILRTNVFLMVLFSATLTSYADPIPLLAGRSLQALKKTDVRIVEEELLVILTLDEMKVRVAIDLKNRGDRTSFPVGFPCESATPDMAGMTCGFPLQIRAKGESLHAVIRPVAEYGRCWVWDMTFEKNEQVLLEIEYSTPIVNERYEVPLAGIWFVHYPLRTGSNWAGPIERLKISVSTPVETIVQIGPPGYVRKPGLLKWELADHEPREDLFIVMDPYQTSRYIDARLAKKDRANPDRGRSLEFAESFLKGMPRYAVQYEMMLGIFRGFHFPPTAGIGRVVRESYEIMRGGIR